MKERPIIMQADSVRGILAGVKTQTRRVLKEQPSAPCAYVTKQEHPLGMPVWAFTDGATVDPAWWPWIKDEQAWLRCPYGVAGQRLWVKETYREPDTLEYLAYKADINTHRWADCVNPDNCVWKSSMFMPRSRSRITLELTDVRIERVQDISEQDAQAEGVCPEFEVDLSTFVSGCSIPKSTYKLGYKHLWDSINLKRGYSWSSNPWVWCLSFRRSLWEAR